VKKAKRNALLIARGDLDPLALSPIVRLEASLWLPLARLETAFGPPRRGRPRGRDPRLVSIEREAHSNLEAAGVEEPAKSPQFVHEVAKLQRTTEVESVKRRMRRTKKA
jgi:hypothetical protein